MSPAWKDQRRPNRSKASRRQRSLSTENSDPNLASETDPGFPIEVVYPLLHTASKAQRKVFIKRCIRVQEVRCLKSCGERITYCHVHIFRTPTPKGLSFTRISPMRTPSRPLHRSVPLSGPLLRALSLGDASPSLKRSSSQHLSHLTVNSLLNWSAVFPGTGARMVHTAETRCWLSKYFLDE